MVTVRGILVRDKDMKPKSSDNKPGWSMLLHVRQPFIRLDLHVHRSFAGFEIRSLIS